MDSEDKSSNSLSSLIRDTPALRQLLLLFGLAASIALGTSAAMWLRGTDMSVLFANINDSEAAEIVASLQASGIPFEIDDRSGALLVPPDRIHEARLNLASAGLPRAAGFGMEMIQQESGITSSQFMENARYHHALETELARTVSTLRPVQSARVHLAVPRSTLFLRDKQRPSASVLVYLFPGRTLEPSQVASVVHLVASSIPDLETSRVTVVDQNGQLLSDSMGSDDVVQSERQLEYVRRVENRYVDRIMALLAPVVGPNSVRATVAADIDFTVQEESREQYDPAGGAVRSEQIQENRNRRSGSQAAGGVPGALSNVPPQPPQTGEEAPADADQAESDPLNESVQQTRNYELDKTLSVTRHASGTLTRLSVAVILDDSIGEDAAGGTAAETGADASRMDVLVAEVEQLARQAVGFDAARGDTITVTSAAFYEAPPPPAIEEPGMFSSPGFWSIVKQVLSILAILVVGWGVVRPIVNMLTTSPGGSPSQALLEGGQGSSASAAGLLTYNEKVTAARQLVGHDAERVATIVRGWVGKDD